MEDLTKGIYLREIQRDDLPEFKKMIQPDREYHDFNGPYYPRMTQEEVEIFIDELENKFSKGEQPLPNKKMIVNDTELIGQVNWYWKSEETKWLEIGIVIFNTNYWGKGIGYTALPLWIDEMFESFPDIVRIGLSTWSGNRRMMKLAKNIGLTKEAEYRKARIVNGEYYDSLSYGILKEDWYGSRS